MSFLLLIFSHALPPVVVLQTYSLVIPYDPRRASQKSLADAGYRAPIIKTGNQRW